MKILLILLFLFPGWISADVYFWQDADGTKHFSDRSSTSATKLKIKPAYGSSDVGGNHSLYSVKTVYDGDTVVLQDGRIIRLLGINTPEIQHRDKMAEAGGEEAKAWLINKLTNTQIRVETDAEQKDNYGRTLAHLFTENGEHINLQLVAAGLAEVSIFPPNLRYSTELLSAEKKAENARIGIWQRPEYRAITVNSLSDTGHRGWTRVVGKVTDIKNSKKFIYLKFSRNFEVRIERKFLSLFPDVNAYVGKKVEARGWINKMNDGFSMLIRHPGSIIVL